MYITPIVDDIREMERREAISREYAPGELEKEIRKHSTRTSAYASLAFISLFSGLGAGYYSLTRDSPGLGMIAVLAGATLTGLSFGAGKVSAIKADAFDLAKEQRAKKSECQLMVGNR